MIRIEADLTPAEWSALQSVLSVGEDVWIEDSVPHHQTAEAARRATSKIRNGVRP